MNWYAFLSGILLLFLGVLVLKIKGKKFINEIKEVKGISFIKFFEIMFIGNDTFFGMMMLIIGFILVVNGFQLS